MFLGSIHDPNPIFVLKEHIDAQWHSIDNLEELNWAGADLELVKALVSEPLVLQSKGGF